MAEQQYFVIGGEYADTSFETPAPGVELEKRGPYSEAEATKIWRGLTAQSVDNAMVRYFLKPADEALGKKYWVVGGEYADSKFTTLAPGRELEVFGPFEKWEAQGFWRGLTAKSVDDALVRYEIRKDYKPAMKAAISTHKLRVRTKTKSVAISAPPTKVFSYLADGENWPRWAVHNFQSAKHRDDGTWDVKSPRGAGKLKLKFEEKTGVLDHDFIDGDGTAWTVPGRLIPCDGGSLVIMTFLKPATMSESDFASDMVHVDDEFTTLRTNIESR
jgi:hypothetical protein